MQIIENRPEIVKKTISEAVNLLCDTVKTTIGPIGSNVLIESDSINPFITNDGVTIAKSIESNDLLINAILNICKESTIKTDEEVGDGTTTTLVLLQTIYNESMKIINEEKYSVIALQNELKAGLNSVLKLLEKEKRVMTINYIYKIANIACGEEYIAKYIEDIYLRLGFNALINVMESNNDKTYYEIKNGMNIDANIASYYFLENDKIEMENAYLLLSNNSINNMESINNIINEIIDESASLLIIADSYSDEVIENLVLLNSQNTINVVALKSPSYGENKNNIMNDIGVFTNGVVFDNNVGRLISNANITNLGKCDIAHISSENCLLINKNIDKYKIERRIEEINSNIDKKLEWQQDLDKIRIASISSGIANIYVGGKTKTELLERKMRVVDAVKSCRVSSNGYLLGCGISLLKVREELKKEIENKGQEVIKKALYSPFKEILYNASINDNEVFLNISKNNFEVGYNVLSNKYGNYKELGIVDSFEVIKKAIENSMSIALMLLNTKSIIVNLHNKEC